ncbi:hypothetical protein [Maricaulis maris]|uniref:hypothetical protein n=1 Tax=Maricaulis maris TaxID=74318 RepID=UPI000EB5027E|nr:hypothetical protein [Maricaulis maris]
MLGRLLDIAIPVLLLGGLAGYLGLLAAGLLAGWQLPYPVSYLWLAATGCPALGVALMYWRACSDRLVLQGDEE